MRPAAKSQQPASAPDSVASLEPAVPAAQTPDLDFCSPEFNAANALNTPGLQPPDPSAQPLDYLAKCRVFLPPEMPESVAHNVRSVKEKVGSEATRMKHQALKERAATAIQRIEESCTVSIHKVMSYVSESSPLACLKAWQLQGNRVRVVTRHAAGVRGVAHGQLIAYDMFMNLLLRDVVEEYTVMIKVWREKPASESQQTSSTPQEGQGQMVGSEQPKAKGRWARKQDHRQRTLAQVLIKGDNVVSVSCLPEGGDVAAAETADSSGEA